MTSELFGNWTLDPDVLHLNHGSFGAAPVAVLEEQQRWRDLLERNPDAFVHETYQPALDEARSRLAGFLGADPEGLAFVPNATTGMNSVLRSLEAFLGPGDEIVLTDHAYNACRNAAVVTAARSGAVVVTAEVPFPIEHAAEYTRRVLDRVGERTRLVILDAVTSPTGLVVPLDELVEALEPEVPVLVDAAHAAGMIPFDISSLGASFVTGNCHKWLCAPKGSAFLHVTEARREQIYPSVIGHGYNDGWPSTGGHLHRQFDWQGTDDPSAWFSVPSAIDTLAAMHPEGWDGIRRHNHELCLAGRDILAKALGIDPPAPDDMIGSIAALPVPDPVEPSSDIFDPLMTALRRRHGIEVPVFAWPEAPSRLIRISAHLYNSLDEYEQLAAALTEELGL